MWFAFPTMAGTTFEMMKYRSIANHAFVGNIATMMGRMLLFQPLRVQNTVMRGEALT